MSPDQYLRKTCLKKSVLPHKVYSYIVTVTWDQLKLRMFKLHRPSRATTFTPNNLDTLEVCDKQDLITIQRSTTTLKPHHTTVTTKKLLPPLANQECPITGQHQIYETQNVRSHWSTPDI